MMNADVKGNQLSGSGLLYRFLRIGKRAFDIHMVLKRGIPFAAWPTRLI